MKPAVCVLCLILFVFSDASISEENKRYWFFEGVHYDLMDEALWTDGEILYFGSYACYQCYLHDRIIMQWINTAIKGSNIKLRTAPVSSAMGRAPLKEYEYYAKAQVIAETLGISDKYKEYLWKSILMAGEGRSPNNQRAQFSFGVKMLLRDEISLKKSFLDIGVEEETLNASINSFLTNVKVKGGDKYAERFGIKSLPIIVVNGKYSIHVIVKRSTTGGRTGAPILNPIISDWGYLDVVRSIDPQKSVQQFGRIQ